MTATSIDFLNLTQAINRLQIAVNELTLEISKPAATRPVALSPEMAKAVADSGKVVQNRKRLPPKTVIRYLDEGTAGQCTWLAWLADNDLEVGQIDEIEHDLATTGEHHGGGGAAAEFHLYVQPARKAYEQIDDKAIYASLAAVLKTMPRYREWRFEVEFNGVWCFTHPRGPDLLVCTTPGWSGGDRRVVDIQVQTTDGSNIAYKPDEVYFDPDLTMADLEDDERVANAACAFLEIVRPCLDEFTPIADQRRVVVSLTFTTDATDADIRQVIDDADLGFTYDLSIREEK